MMHYVNIELGSSAKQTKILGRGCCFRVDFLCKAAESFSIEV